jgi:hypothetical protein
MALAKASYSPAKNCRMPIAKIDMSQILEYSEADYQKEVRKLKAQKIER